MKNILLFINIILLLVLIGIIFIFFRYDYVNDKQGIFGVDVERTYKVDRLTGEACQIVGNGDFSCNTTK